MSDDLQDFANTTILTTPLASTESESFTPPDTPSMATTSDSVLTLAEVTDF